MAGGTSYIGVGTPSILTLTGCLVGYLLVLGMIAFFFFVCFGGWVSFGGMSKSILCFFFNL